MTLSKAQQYISLDIVLPAYNEDENLDYIHKELTSVLHNLDVRYKLIFVDDGSDDETKLRLKKLKDLDPLVRVVELTRNFGHQAALTAGLDYSDADLVIMMDADGQHPPSLIPEMLELHRTGYDIVYTQRINEAGLSPFKRVTSRLFYGFINRISGTEMIPGSADFRLVTREVVDNICQMREYHRFLRGMFSWVGYRSIILPFTPPERFAGQSKYSLRRMVSLALTASFSFSMFPLYVVSFIGLVFLILSGLEIVYVLSFWFRGLESTLAPGWSSLMFVLLFVGGILLSVLGIIGLYVGFIFQEVKQRPLYIVKSNDSKDQDQGEA